VVAGLDESVGSVGEADQALVGLVALVDVLQLRHYALHLQLLKEHLPVLVRVSHLLQRVLGHFALDGVH
jgi:hypothetical protein